MDQNKILVTGATGNVGRHVVSGLLDKGVGVRALTRDPDSTGLPAGVELARGDLFDPGTLEAALDGVGAVFLLWPSFAADGAAPVVEAIARNAGRLVYLSALAAAGNGGRLEGVWGGVERLIEGPGIREWTFLRPSGFAANTLAWAGQIRAGNTVRWPYGQAARSLIHERDVAAVAVRALVEDGHVGERYALTGPEAPTQAEQVRIIGEAVGRPLRWEELSPQAARRELLAAWGDPSFVDGAMETWAKFVGTPEPVTTTVEDVTRTPARPFREWALEHAGDFRDARTEALANEYVSLFRESDLEGATSLYAEGFVRVEQTEAFGPPVELRGEEVRRNMESNEEEEEVHAFEIDGPFVGGDPNRFAVRFSFDSTFRSSGERKRYSKVCLYTAEDGKLVREDVYHEPLR